MDPLSTAVSDATKSTLLDILRALDNVRVYESPEPRSMAVATFEPGTTRPRLYTPPIIGVAGSVSVVTEQVRTWISAMRDTLAELGAEYFDAPALVMIASLSPVMHIADRVTGEERCLLNGAFQIQVIRQCEFETADVFVDRGGFGKYQAVVDAFKKTQ